jgi:hypothetical protein
MDRMIDIPQWLYDRARVRAKQRGQTVEEFVLMSLERELGKVLELRADSAWARRKLLPGYKAALEAGVFAAGTDSAEGISLERDVR